MVFPAVLGTGGRVFDELSERREWTLAEANPVGPEGVITVAYRRAR